MRCKSCETEMEGRSYGSLLDCQGDMEYDSWIFPLDLKCPECGKYDWKHNHNMRWLVIHCNNEDCKDPDVVYSEDHTRWFDYSRIPFPHSLPLSDRRDSLSEYRELEKEFGTSDRRALVRLGKKLKMKEIEKRTKGLMKIRNN